MNRKRTILIGILGLLAVWAVAGAVVLFAQSRKVTPEKVVAYLDGADLDEMSDADRAAWVDGLATRVNRLDFEQRRKNSVERSVRDAFLQMTPEERRRYLDQTLPQGFKEMFTAINEMSREERQKLVNRALEDIRKAEASGEDERFEEEVDEEMVQQVVNEGMRQYLSEASAEAKLDMQPLIEAMQGRMRKVGR